MKQIYTSPHKPACRIQPVLPLTLTISLLWILISWLPLHAQGLEDIIVEKYYVADGTDAADKEGGTLANGAVTYRIFVDMATGYKFKAVFGVPENAQTSYAGHELVLSTTSMFFNNTDRGKESGEKVGSNRVDDNTTAIDSWVSVGGSSSGHIAVLKTDDTDGSIVGQDALLTNDDPYAGIPLSQADGFIAGTPQSTTALGIDLDDWFGEFAGNTGPVLSTSDGSWASLNGSSGPDGENRVLIGQFTTDGTFSYEMNIQLVDQNGLAENYVARNADMALQEIYYPLLLNTVSKDIKAPSVTITNPSDGAILPKEQVVTLSVDVSDIDGTIDSVEYVLNGNKIGASGSAPFDITWQSEEGIHSLTAVATDNDGARSLSENTEITVVGSANVNPQVTLTAPAEGSYFSPGEAVTLRADAFDPDGEISRVEFYVNDALVGSDDEDPYTYEWTTEEGSFTIRAKAIDNHNGTATTDPVTISVTSNDPPTTSITQPEDGSVFLVGETITISADASDSDGLVDSVECFVNDIKIGAIENEPYSFEWTGNAGNSEIIAKATDDDGDSHTDTVQIVVNIPPTITLLSPLDRDTINTGDLVTLTVDARDSDGSVDTVRFLINREIVSTDTEKPFEHEWTSIEGDKELTVIAIDNHGAHGADTIDISVMETNSILPSRAAVGLKVYPNPASQWLQIDMCGLNSRGKTELRIVSITGKVIMGRVKYNNASRVTEQVDISGLAPGLYFIHLTSDGHKLVRKMVKK